MSGPLAGIRVLDLSRVLAGPWCTQILADLGAEVIKIERPGTGDDTRHWGPPWLKDEQGNPTAQSGYFLSANRGKNSVTVDIGQPEGQALIKELAAKCDILVENLFQRVVYFSYLFALYRLGESEHEDADDPFPKGRIPFLTIHQSKGLEFPVVVMVSPRKDNRGPMKALLQP